MTITSDTDLPERLSESLARAIEHTIDQYTLVQSALLGVAVQCDGGIGGKVVALTDEMVTFLRVRWSRYDLRTEPYFWHETHRRSTLTNVMVATPVTPIRIR